MLRPVLFGIGRSKKTGNYIMLKMKLITVISLACLLAFATGCESYAEHKEAATLRWKKATAMAMIPVVRGQLENGELDEAEKTLKESLLVDTQNAEAHLLMGKVHLARARMTQASDSLRSAVQLDDSLDSAWYLLGAIAQQDRQTQRALENYTKAMSLKPDNVDYIIAVAETYTARGQYTSAVNLLETKSAFLPGCVKLKVALADVQNRLGNTKQAISLYNRVLLLEPGDYDITEALAYCYIIDKQWHRAAETFEKLVAVADTERKANYLKLLGMCSMNAGDYGKAVMYYDQLSIDNRDDDELWLQMGQAALGAGASGRAYACAARALSLRPAWPDAIALKACAQYLGSDYTAAIKTFKGITSDKRVGAFAWTITARCYQQLGHAARAKKAYEQAAKLSPDSELLSLMMDKYVRI